ncbi:hypothetical protein J1N35_041432 [Gossypium stocksii]|uniref:Uncharacterized protein n=1 Tax=Gossypium stocksii TaxID=47602 RepID=A0A9D3ZJP9_9ROSI|nr:hypothetical protein J1N35_041432 [Gossypium stocksii]
MTANAYKMETIIRDRSKNFEREKIKKGRLSPPPLASFKRPRDQIYSVLRRDL